MKRVLVVLLIVVLGGVTAALWFGQPYFSEWARVRLERELSRAIGMPCSVAELRVALLPLRIHVGDLAIGAAPVVARVTAIDASLAALSSLAEGRAVVSLRIDAPTVDLSLLPHTKTPSTAAHAQASTAPRVPPLHLDAVEVTQAALRFRMGNDTADLTVDRLRAQLQAARVRAGFTATLAVQGAELRRKAYVATLQDIRADGGVDDGGLYLSSATVQGDRISARVAATLVRHRHTGEATFDPGILGVVVDELAVVSGQAHLTATLTGDLLDPVNEGQLTITQGAIANHVLGDLSTHVTHRGAKLGFDTLRLVGARGQVTGTVDMVVVDEVPIHGTLNWEGVDLERLLAIIGTDVPLTTQFSATTAVHGSLDPLDLDVQGAGRLQPAQAEHPKDVASFTIAGRIHADDLDAQLEVTQPEQNTVTARVLIAGDDFGGTVHLAASDLAALNPLLPRPLPELTLAGQGDGRAEFGGTTDHPTVRGTLALRNASIVGTRVTRLTGDFDIARGTLRTQATTLETAGGQVGLDGVIALEAETSNDWRLTLRDLETDLLLGTVRNLTAVEAPVSGGRVNGTLACRGPWERTQVQAALTIKGVQVAAEPLEQVDIEVATALPQWKGTVTAVRAAGETLTVTGSGEGTTRVDLTLETTPLQLATVRGAQHRNVTGTVVARGRIRGTLSQPGGSVELSATDLGFGDRHLGAVDLRGDGVNGSWKLTGTALDGAVALGGTVQATGGLPYTTTVTWQDANLAPFLTTDDTLRLTTSGTLSLAGSLQSPATPSGALRVNHFVFTQDQWRIEAPEPMRIDFDRGRFRIGALALASQGSRLSVSGGGTLAGDLDLDVQGEGDLVLLEVIGDPLQAARGAVSVRAQIAHHPPGGWDLRGQATLRDVTLDLGLPVAFTDTSGTFSLSGSSLHIDQLSGRAGGGDFTIGGSLDLDRGPDISWSVREVSLAFPEWLEERVAGKGRVHGTWKRLTVAGDIEVLNALYDRKIELGALLPWFKEQLAPAREIEPPAREVYLDLRIHAPDGLFVDNNFAKAQMRCDLRITGRAQQPALAGVIEILEGEVTFRNRLFTLSGGAVDFRDPYRINPILNINAESQISTTEAEYTVRVAVTGTADNPRVQFSADDPALTQNDVLSLVTFGRTTTQERTDGGTVGVGNVLGLVPGDYDVQGRVRTLFGVDRFEVEPAYVRDTGAIEPRVTIGKDVTDQLRAQASSSFGAEAHHSMQLEYRVTRRISLLGTWETATQSQEGAWGADVKFRYEFRRLPFSLQHDQPCVPASDAP